MTREQAIQKMKQKRQQNIFIENAVTDAFRGHPVELVKILIKLIERVDELEEENRRRE